ncbi:hypothetical protein IHE61_21250 [Streptomyces sp. GKU 257-1]|nr:hypothetical protein [Streptomyces sp. GKU 257-1]
MSPDHAADPDGTPLKFLPAVDKIEYGRVPRDNADVICPSGWAKKKKGNPDATPVNAQDTLSCDEFAYASTYNSGGMPSSMEGLNPVKSGDQCVQTCAQRTEEGEWHLFDDMRQGAPHLEGEVRPVQHVQPGQHGLYGADLP